MFTGHKLFEKSFCKKFLGTSSLERENFLLHKNPISSILYDLNDFKLVLIADGTYLFCEKSLNNDLQKQLYSRQKKHINKTVCCLYGQWLLYRCIWAI